MSKDRFVPEDSEVPIVLETNRFRLRMLSVYDVEKDYEAVIESRELLHAMFGGSGRDQGSPLRKTSLTLRSINRSSSVARSLLIQLCPWMNQGFWVVSASNPQKLPTQTLLW